MAYLAFGPLPNSVTTPAMNKLVHEVLEAQENAWVKGLSRTIEKNRLMLRHTINVTEGLLSTHVSCFNDATLVKLAKQQNFPRGFVIFIDIGEKELRGLGSFYPKFANDQRQQSMDDVYNKDVSRLSFYLKYSGSLGITTLFHHRGRVCYTVSSKNSCDAVGRPEDEGKRTLFPKKGHEVLQTYIDASGGALMQELWDAGVRTVGSENFYDDDVSHGYAYNRSGMVVTALCRIDLADTKANPLSYFSPAELYETCTRVGLPVDKPMTLTDPAKMQALVRVIGTHRNYLTLSLLLQVLAEAGIELETVHAEYVKGDIIEGFVVRRWARRGGEEVELPSVKWKCWCYQMVTQCLRPFLTKEAGKGLDYRQDLRPLRNAEGVVHPRFEEMMERAVKHWCVFPRGSDAAVVRQKVVARWLLYRAVEASPCSDRDITFNAEKHVEAYWAYLARVAVDDFSEQMQRVGWDLARFCPTAPTLDAVAAQAGCGGDVRHSGRVVPIRRYAEGDRVLLVPVGVPLMGKSSTLRAVARLANGTVFHTTQDDHSGFRTFAAAVKRAMAAAEEAEEASSTAPSEDDAAAYAAELAREQSRRAEAAARGGGGGGGDDSTEGEDDDEDGGRSYRSELSTNSDEAAEAAAASASAAALAAAEETTVRSVGLAVRVTVEESDLCFVLLNVRLGEGAVGPEAVAARSEATTTLLKALRVKGWGRTAADAAAPAVLLENPQGNFHHTFVAGSLGDEVLREIQANRALAAFAEGDLVLPVGGSLGYRIVSHSLAPEAACAETYESHVPWGTIAEGRHAVAAVFRAAVNLTFSEAFSTPSALHAFSFPSLVLEGGGSEVLDGPLRVCVHADFNASAALAFAECDGSGRVAATDTPLVVRCHTNTQGHLRHAGYVRFGVAGVGAGTLPLRTVFDALWAQRAAVPPPPALSAARYTSTPQRSKTGSSMWASDASMLCSDAETSGRCPTTTARKRSVEAVAALRAPHT
eukprot:Rhum_TRINITY_DN15096_c1_g1::Rhum_TRINITY_DN15096_c1_g1_i1::g.136715::m.136715